MFAEQSVQADHCNMVPPTHAEMLSILLGSRALSDSSSIFKAAGFMIAADSPLGESDGGLDLHGQSRWVIGRS